MKTKIRLPHVFPVGSVPDGGQVTNDFLAVINAIDTSKSRSIVIPSFGSDEAVAVEDGTVGIVIPSDMDEWRLTKVLSSVLTPSSSETVDIQIRRTREEVDTDLLTTKLTISEEEYFAEDGVIDETKNMVRTGDLIFVDCDSAGTDTYGLFTVLTFEE